MKKVGRPKKVVETQEDVPTIMEGMFFRIEDHIYKVTYRELKNRDHITIVLDLEA